MNLNTSHHRKSVLLLVLLLFSPILFALATTVNLPVAAAADVQPSDIYCGQGIKTSPGSNQTKITVDLPINEVIGDSVTAYATLTDENGSPIVAAPVLFYVSGEHASKDAPPVWIGHAVTDCDGVAIIRFTRQEAGQMSITAKFLGGNGFQPNEITATLELKRLAQNQPDIAGMGTIGITALVGVIGAAAIMGAVVAVREDKKDELTQQ